MAPSATHFLPSADIRKQFSGLSSNDQEARIEAAKSLNLALKATTDNREETIKYCLTRLIKGLTSSNDSSRLGFSLALVELLYALLSPSDPLLPTLHLRAIIALLVEHTNPIGGLTKQEERGFYFGRLFGLKALIETGLILNKEAEPSAWQSVLSQLIQLGQKKPWLRESCCLVIRNAVLSLESSQKESIRLTCEELEKAGFLRTSDGVGIWLALLQKHRKVVVDKLGIKFNKRSSPLEKSYLTNLAKILKESEGQDEENKKLAQKGSWSPRLSWVWDAIFEFYTSTRKLDANTATFTEFWSAVVNDSLFSNSSSEERKFWGFLVFNKALSTFDDPETISALFSPNFMKCFINQLAAPERYLHKAAQKSLKVIKTKGETTPAAIPTLLTNILSNNGSQNFESITKTKIIEPLFSSAPAPELLSIVQLFKSFIIDAKPPSAADEEDDKEAAAEDTKVIERTRQWAADQLLSIIRSNKVAHSDAWISEIVILFTSIGHLQSDYTTSVTAATQATFRTRLLSSLSELLQNKDTQSTLWPAKAVLYINDSLDAKNSDLVIQADDTIQEQMGRVFKIVAKLSKKPPAPGSRKYAFALMYSLLLLQLFNGEPDAVEMLEDLHLVYESIGKDSSKKDKKKAKKDKHRQKRAKHDHDHDHSDDEEVDSEEGGLEILVELLLGFLAKQSVLAKKMSQTVFRSFAESLTPSALDALLRPLGVDENQDGQRELFDIQDDEDEEMEDAGSDDDSDEEEDSDVEVIDVEDGSDEDDEEEDSSDPDSDSSGDDDDDAPPDEETLKLEAALAAALGNNSDAEDSDGDSDSSMDDDQMMLVDEHLSKIFQQRKKTPNKKQQKASAKETVVNFKNRILELLEIFVKSPTASNDLKIRVIVPCLQAIRKTGNQAVKTHAQSVLRGLTSANKKKAAAAAKDKEEAEDAELGFTDVDAAFEVLKEIHAESSKAGGQQGKEHPASCSQCSLHVAKILITSAEGGKEQKVWIEKVSGLYFGETMVLWMISTGSGTQPSLFTDFVTWAGQVRKTLTAGKAKKGKKVEVVKTAEKVEVNGKDKKKKDKKRKRKST